MRTYFLNPHVGKHDRYIREGRCMQKASSWVTIWPPVGLATLAAIARKKGEVRLIDGNVEQMHLKDLLQDIQDFDPDLVVVNTGFPSIDADMDMAHSIKNVYPNLTFLGFGLYFTLLEEKGFNNYPYLDFAIIGEPEETFEELLDVMSAERDQYDKVKGIIYRDSSGVVVTLSRTLIKDIDKIPFPDRSLLQTNKYKLPHNNRPFTLINSSRGCPYQCIYCIVSPYYGRQIRAHSIDYVMEEIRECVGKYQIKDMLFWEEVFTLEKNRIMTLCDAICQENLSISWAATTRVDRLDEEIVMKMKEAGCYLLGLGIESGDQAILDNAKKNIKLEQIIKAVELCKKAGIKTMGHFIFGLPGETRITASKTIKFMSELGLDYMQSYCAVPYPKTELGELARKKNWICATRWSDYDFGGDSILHTETMMPEDVTYFRKKAFKSFYFKPSSVIRISREIGVRRLCKFLTFIKWINFRIWRSRP